MNDVQASTDTAVFILCAGKAARFNGRLKQLFPIGDETILARIQRQVMERGLSPIVVTHRPAIQAVSDYWMVPKTKICTCATLLSTKEYWAQRTIILLGDVIYSKDAMNQIMGCKKKLAFIGNRWETFALSFSTAAHESLLEHIQAVVADYKGIKGHHGKLATLFRSVIGKSLGEMTSSTRAESDLFVYISDWTMDIDSDMEYSNALRNLVGGKMIDDLAKAGK